MCSAAHMGCRYMALCSSLHGRRAAGARPLSKLLYRSRGHRPQGSLYLLLLEARAIALKRALCLLACRISCCSRRCGRGRPKTSRCRRQRRRGQPRPRRRAPRMMHPARKRRCAFSRATSLRSAFCSSIKTADRGVLEPHLGPDEAFKEVQAAHQHHCCGQEQELAVHVAAPLARSSKAG